MSSTQTASDIMKRVVSGLIFLDINPRGARYVNRPIKPNPETIEKNWLIRTSARIFEAASPSSMKRVLAASPVL